MAHIVGIFWLVVGFATSNAVALVVGCYVGYRYGDAIEEWIGNTIGRIQK